MKGGAIRLPGAHKGSASWASSRRNGAQSIESRIGATDEPDGPSFSLPLTSAAASATGDESEGETSWQGVAWARNRRSQRRRQLSQRPRRRWRRWVVAAVLFIAITSYAAIFLASEAATDAQWTPDAESISFSKRPLPAMPERSRITQFALPLRTKGRNIVDQDGRRFKLSSINWYGASDELFVPGGLEVQHRSVIAQSIKRLGFNSVRLPYADELVTQNPIIDSRLLKANPDLIGRRALDILDAVTATLTEEGIAVVVNNHITRATWCCGANPCDAGWANDHLMGICKVQQTEDEWIRNWETVMARYANNSLVIGADLRNEVRGLWGTMPWSRWASAAERCGNRLLKMNSNWIIVVEGTESANDLRGARARPVKLDVAHRLVYSAHVYAWSGWGSWGGRFSKRTYGSFRDSMRNHWGYLLDEDTAPVWVGEVGASDSPTVGDANYWKNLLRYLKEVDADFGYWALNPRKPKGNTTETYALVADDWITPVLDYRMKDMVDLMMMMQ